MFYRSLALCTLLLLAVAVSRSTNATPSYWRDIAAKVESGPDSRPAARASQSRRLQLRLPELTDSLANAGMQSEISLPLPGGGFITYRLRPSAILPDEMAARFPALRSYRGHQLGQPDNQGVFELTPAGFHGMFEHQGETVFVNPVERGDNQRYLNYYKRHAKPLDSMSEWPPQRLVPAARAHRPAQAARDVVSQGLTSYRIAISTSAEYSQFHGNSVESVTGALLTLLNRLNHIFEQDLGVRLVLANNNDQVIFFDELTDPFENSKDDHQTNVIVQRQYLGSNSFDLGHVLNTSPGGIATLSVICNDSHKSSGATGSRIPVNDSFYLDLVAHELGHQFGAAHSFNGSSGSCEDNRVAGSAYEPGSGSTLMAYAGLCGSENIQSNSSAFFHGHSINQIQTHLAQTSCGIPLAQGNRPPAITPLTPAIVPARTPLQLTASATDPDGDSLSYIWEQLDLGSASFSRQSMVDDGRRPIFRSWEPGPSPSRYLPRQADILDGHLSAGEAWATTSRLLTFQLTVRDGNGGVSRDRTILQVDGDSGPFAILQPNGDSTWSRDSRQLVEWQVAGTDAAPVNCPRVTISLSRDAGEHFDTILLAGTANDGFEEIALPMLSARQARIKVACDNNLFFAISPGNFRIVHPAPEISGQAPLTMAEDDSFTIELFHLTVSDIDSRFPGNFSLTVLPGSHYRVEGQRITPEADYEGLLEVGVQISDGTYDSNVFPLLIDVIGRNDPPQAVADSFTVSRNSQNNLLSVLLNDIDPDANDPLQLHSVDYQGSGQLILSNNQLRYTPASEFVGDEQFSYTIRDGAGLRSSASVTISVNQSAALPAEASAGNSGGGVFNGLVAVALPGLG